MNIPQLALALRVPQTRIRQALLDSGFRDESKFQNQDLPDAAEGTVDHLITPEPLHAETPWVLRPGDVVERTEVHAAYGGSRRSGIVTFGSGMPDIAIFSSLESGSEFGYDVFEGPQPDGSFAYTGQGQSGDQVFKRGNLGLRDANSMGKAIRLFGVKGTSVTYVGRYATGIPPYRLEQIPSREATELREGIIFNLEPVDAEPALLARRAAEASGFEEFEWTPPVSEGVIAPAPLLVDERVITRVEFELQGEFGTWLRTKGLAVRRLTLKKVLAPLTPDLFVPTNGWVIEAKRATSRDLVRTAIGQVLDYAHLARKNGLAAEPIILLPGQPVADLVELTQVHGIAMIARQSAGGFARLISSDLPTPTPLTGDEILPRVVV